MKLFLVDDECLCGEDVAEVSQCEVADLPPDLALAVAVLPGPECRPHLEHVELLDMTLRQSLHDAPLLLVGLHVDCGQSAVEVLHCN